MLTTNQKGAIAETAIVHAAVKLGIEVYRPVSEGGRYDLILGLIDRLVRVQCNWALRRGDVVSLRCYSFRRTANGYLKRSYSPEEIDAFAAYCAELDRCYFLPIELFPQQRAISLRIGPARNNQRSGINWAESFEFTARLGAASLGP